MRNITIKEVLYEMTYRFDKKTTIQNLLGDDLSDETYDKLYDKLSILFGDGLILKNINIVMSVIEDIYEGFDDDDRDKIVFHILNNYPNFEYDTIVLTLN